MDTTQFKGRQENKATAWQMCPPAPQTMLRKPAAGQTTCVHSTAVCARKTEWPLGRQGRKAIGACDNFHRYGNFQLMNKATQLSA
jgi:hypothetical protein